MKNLRGHLYTILAFALVIGTASCNPAAAPLTATIPPTATAAPTIQPGDSTRTLTVNGLKRDYLLHIPPGLERSRAVPVVLAFSGYGMTPSNLQTLTGFNDVANKDGFLVAYPKGTGSSDSELSWNAGICCGAAQTNNVDELAFVREILKDLGTVASLDTKSIYAVGFSNGGVLLYRLACEMSDTIAAIAPVSGLLADSPCQPQQPVSVIHVHGTADPLIDIAGAEQSIETWAQLDGCTGSAHVEKLGTVITHAVHDSCRAGTAIELYTISGGKHEWPSNKLLPTAEAWPTIIWEFFAAHPKP